MTCYSAKVVVRAREHREAGWSIRRTIDLIDSEFGVRPAHQTVRDWCMDPGVLRERRAVHSSTRYWGRGKSAKRFSEAWKTHTIMELRAAGLSFRSVGVVAGVWWGEPQTAEQVRYRVKNAERSHG